MKTIVNLFLILWLSFLSAPTVIGWLADANELQITYNMAEEENANETEPNPAEETHEELFFNLSILYIASLNLDGNKLLYGANKNTITVYEDVYSPPPELV
ncbi:hypothetical protein K5I29_04390 [Flavobacterium agricola]|uniref:Uncharacterized protein n=1 Tax=Flavobacterium agricola TaxID=2870839 RepID=A0ABY6M137_9FLAO|nr:hypothetical protein [Flavobacterium agricola]UYW02146.1 hypothetical protein K5I29_04390 [Flavobacterium agricola]